MRNNLPAEAFRQRWLVCNEDKFVVRRVEFNDALTMVQQGKLKGSEDTRATNGPLILGGIDLVVPPANNISKNLILLIDEAFGRIIQFDKYDETLTQWSR